MKTFLDEISHSVQNFYEAAIDPVAERYSFQTRQSEGGIQGPPMVFLLGNHSSGKSTFINYLLGEDVQKTGLAPTDDAFTIIAHGPREECRDGPAVVSNPELRYEGLRQFGMELVTHLRMKLQPIPLLEEITLIDSPGMIDNAKDGNGREFDFPGVVRWFAEQADVVLIFFDPDKPGTTGETLQVFNESLTGIDHKLLIVMNKMDQFRSLQDMARAYGALCWNLGRVIARKDLPHIYNTYVSVPGAPEPVLPVEDFERAREELVAEVKRAPARRLDNVLTHAQDFAERVRTHARVVSAASRELRRFRFRTWSAVFALVLFLGIAGAVSTTQGADIRLTIGLFGGALLFAVAGIYRGRAQIRREEKHIVAGLDGVFERLYVRELLVLEHAQDLNAVWASIAPRTRETVEKLGLLSFPRPRAAEIRRLDALIDEEIPKIRSDLHRKLGAVTPEPVAVTPAADSTLRSVSSQ